MQTVGESEHNATRLETIMAEQESKYDSGIFLLRDSVGFSGTIVDVQASGYCTVVNRTTEQPFELRLALYDYQTRERTLHIPLPADCDLFTNDTPDASNLTILCSVQSKKRISVPADHSLGILFSATCSPEDGANRCSCRPATVDRDTEQYLYLDVIGKTIMLPRTTGREEELSLQFSFTIEAGKMFYVCV